MTIVIEVHILANVLYLIYIYLCHKVTQTEKAFSKLGSFTSKHCGS